MHVSNNDLQVILRVLRERPDGLTVTAIAREAYNAHLYDVQTSLLAALAFLEDQKLVCRRGPIPPKEAFYFRPTFYLSSFN